MIKKEMRVGAMSFNGGLRENFYFCILDYFQEENRWFLTSLDQLKDMKSEVEADGSDSGEKYDSVEDDDHYLLTYLQKKKLHHLMVDFPLTLPPCAPCLHGCSSTQSCQQEEVQLIRKKIKSLLEADEERRLNNPKKYEHDRNLDDLISPFKKYKKRNGVDDHDLLSKSFKRRLKKGFLPYWNRSVDFWVWEEYFDQLLKYLKTSFDSFGDTSLMLLFRFAFLKENFSPKLHLYESRVPLILIELMRAGIVSHQNLQALSGTEAGAKERLDFIHAIEKSLKVFIYDQDIEVLVKTPRAFHSFLLSLAGQRLLLRQVRELPPWTPAQEKSFIIPQF